MLATARRMRKSIKIHLIHLKGRVAISRRPRAGIEPGSASVDIEQVGTAQGMAILKAFTERVKADAIATDDDWTLLNLARNRGQFEPVCRVLAPDAGALDRLWDKLYQIRLAKECGFNMLPTYTLKSAEDVAALPRDVFPAVVRPSYLGSARPSFKAKVLASRDETSRLYDATAWTHPPIVQRFCLGPNMVLHGVREQSGKWLKLQLFNVYRKYRGFSASMEPAPLPAQLEAAARRFVEAARLVGPFHFDLLVNGAEGAVYFLEINARLGGSTGRAIKLGYDEPALLFSAFNAVTVKPLAPLLAWPRVTSVRLNMAQAWNDLRNRRDPLAYPQLPRTKSVLAALMEVLLVRHG
jgi:predicted ATP-grasp superfamily ATP-dependent carboligase